MNRNDEHIRDALEGLYGSEDAERVEREIAEGDALFDTSPAPAAGSELTDAIKSAVRAKLAERKRRARSFRYVASAAAVIIIASLISFTAFNQKAEQSAPAPAVSADAAEPSQSGIDTDIWEEDVVLTAYSEELDDIEQTIRELRLGENGSEAESELSEIEYNMYQSNGDFWKG